MRKLAFYACLALTLLLAGCVKEKIVTQPCNFTLKINEVRGSKVKFTVTPDNPDATYVFGVMLYEEETAGWPDEKLIEWQLDWMKNSYKEYSAQTQPCGSFADMYCYKGERSIKNTKLSQGTEYLIIILENYSRIIFKGIKFKWQRNKYNNKYKINSIKKARNTYYKR